MYKFSYQIRVCYADTDQMGYVYYGNYARYYEIARVEALRNLGFSYKQLEASGVMMPVYDLHTRYLQAARYDDLLTVEVFVKEMPKVRMIFDYEIFNESKSLLTTGSTTLVFINMINSRLCLIPEALAKKLAIFFND
ncbi:MAG: acyl-CoA thioesterase [Verrucomicrobia bacterium]|nr:acyl-CoA thioesterase [Cytophagales bacterium]